MSTLDAGSLAADLATVAPFDRAHETSLGALAEHLRRHRLAPGDVLVTQGDVANDLYVVLDGELAVALDDGPTLARLGPGSVVGEIALVAGGRRSATVAAATACEVIGIGGDALTHLLDREPEVAGALASAAIDRLRHAQLAAHAAPLFGDDPAVVADLTATVTWRTVEAGEVLFEPGDPADAVYLVIAGRLHAVDPAAEGRGRDHSPGELVGEGALIGEDVHRERVHAVRDTDLVQLSCEAFDRFAQRHPAAALQVTRSVARALRRGHASRLTDRRTTIAVVPAFAGLDLRLFTSRLAERLGLAGDVAHLWSARVDSQLGREGAAQSRPDEAPGVRLRHYLEEVEDRHRFVVYELDERWTAWNERVVRLADRILVVVDADADPAPTELERHLDAHVVPGRGAQRTLVLVHDPATELPRGTAAWLESRPGADHLHVRLTDVADVDRLARTIAGTATGLVLGGGGAKGFAHLGVIRALRELGVPIDLVGGASIGSIMAITAALEWPSEELVPRIGARFRKVLDHTLPVVSVYEGRRLARALDDELGDTRIEDLWRPYFCVSTNLTQACEVVHERGSLARAIRASIAIPGVLPPVADDGDLLVDGGVLDNLPIERMRERNPDGQVIAVDVIPPRGARVKGDLGMSVSGWGLLARRLTPGVRAPKVPGLAMTLLGSTLVTSMRDRNAHRDHPSVDLFLDVDVRGYSLLDFDTVEEVAEAAYRSVRPRLEAWLETGVDPGAIADGTDE